MWLGGRVEEVADQRDALRGVDDERDRLTKAISEAHAEEERLRAGLRALLSLVGSHDVTEEEFRGAKRDNDEKLRDVATRTADLQSRLEAPDPRPGVPGAHLCRR